MSSGEENASQGSSLSLDLQLSQDTVNQVLSAVGMSSGSDGNRYPLTAAAHDLNTIQLITAYDMSGKYSVLSQQDFFKI